MKRVALLMMVLSLAACEKDKSAFLDELSSFQVTVTNGNPGSEATPLDFSSAGIPFSLSVQAINGHGQPMAFDGPVTLSAVPGTVTPSVVTLTGGVGSVDLDLASSFGKTRIWAEDKGTADAPGTFATGVTEILWFRNPTIRAVQQSTTTTTSPFEGQRVTVTEGTMVVTHTTNEGFFVTDTADTDWNSMYMFTFNAPGGGLKAGDTLSRLSGTLIEFLGFTEMQNAVWTVSGEATVPPPVVLDCTADVSAGGLQMERFESSVVEVSGADIEVCSSFPSCPDLDQYSQWTISLPCGARMNVVSDFALPDLDPRVNQGQQLTTFRGTLRHVQFASPQWILEPRGEGDVCCPTCVPAMSGGC